MAGRFGLLLGLIFAVNCPLGWGMASANTSQTGQDSLLEVGDFIEYRFRWPRTGRLVVLAEEVVAKSGRLLTILVAKSEGDRTTKWKQMVVDTPENRRAGRVEALFLITPDGEKPLPNEGNRDLHRLFEGTFVPQDAPPFDLRVKRTSAAACGRTVDARAETGKVRVGDEVFAYREITSDTFPWGLVSTGYHPVDGGLPLLEMQISACRLVDDERR